MGDARARILMLSSDLPQECLYPRECRKASREAFSGGEKAGGRRSREHSGWVSGHRSRGEISVWGTQSPGNAGHREESGSPESSGAQATEGCRAGGAVTHYGTKHNPFGYSGATHCDTVAVRQGRGGEAQPQAAAPEVGEVT